MKFLYTNVELNLPHHQFMLLLLLLCSYLILCTVRSLRVTVTINKVLSYLILTTRFRFQFRRFESVALCTSLPDFLLQQQLLQHTYVIDSYQWCRQFYDSMRTICLPKSASFSSPISLISKFWGFKSLSHKTYNYNNQPDTDTSVPMSTLMSIVDIYIYTEHNR